MAHIVSQYKQKKRYNESNYFLRELHYSLNKWQTENEIVKILLQHHDDSSSQKFQLDSKI